MGDQHPPPNTDRFLLWVADDPRKYEEAIAEQVRPVASALSAVKTLEAVRVAGNRPDSAIEIVFRPALNEDCRLGWRWPIWDHDYAPLHLDDAEIEIITPLMEWLDLEGPKILADLDCGGQNVVWVGG
jgi:hypothetical protein